MIDHVRVTDALPVVAVAPVYSPACLLDVSCLDARITTDNDFVDGCECGYQDYFEPDETGPSVVLALTAPHTLSQILENLLASLLSLVGESDSSERIPFLIGFCVGWLSAIAVAQPDEAATGMLVLTSVVTTLFEQGHVHLDGLLISGIYKSEVMSDGML